MWTGDGVSGPERPMQRFGDIVVVGGGCYGSYYVRQLRRARAAGAVAWDRLLVVDHDPGCAIAADWISQISDVPRLVVTSILCISKARPLMPIICAAAAWS